VYFNTEYNEEEKASNYPNIAIDNNDNISIVILGRYKENIYWETKHISKCNEKWQFKDARKSSSLMKFRLMDEYSDMCVDENGGLHLFACANVGINSVEENWMSATYFYKAINSDKWQMEMIMPGIANEKSYAADPSIATSGEKVFVTIGGDKNLHFANKNISENKWQIEEVKEFAFVPKTINTWKFETSTTTTPNGNPVFAFYEYYGESDYHGINILSKSNCSSSNWDIDHSLDEPVYKRAPAIAINSKGKVFVAFGGRDFSLFARTCDCNQKWEQVFSKSGNSTLYTDIVIDKNNVVNAFYTSEYDNNLYLLKVVENGEKEVCNYPPTITSYSGKTNLKAGEKWVAMVKASDYECDKIKFESVIHNDIFKVTDDGNGKVTISALMPSGEGEGTPGITLWALDDKHTMINSETSSINFKLVISPDGKKMGSITVENKCVGHNILPKNIDGGDVANIEEVENNADSNNGDINAKCNKFLDRYESYADKHVELVNKIKANPMDMNAAQELSAAVEKFSSYATEWENLYDCQKNLEFKARYDKATNKIQSVN
jgi:hypothetical protein